jgi:hypothetical protein
MAAEKGEMPVMRIRLPILAFAASFVAAPALANCPVAGDLDQGIRVSFANGGQWIARAAGGGTVSVDIRWNSEMPEQHAQLARGVYVTELRIDGEAEPIRFAFAPGIDTAPTPAPGASWRVAVEQTGGVEPGVAAATYRWGAAQEVEIGTCRLEALSLAHTQPFRGWELETDYLYLTDLGVLLMTEQRADGDVLVDFDPVSIEVLP